MPPLRFEMFSPLRLSPFFCAAAYFDMPFFAAFSPATLFTPIFRYACRADGAAFFCRDAAYSYFAIRHERCRYAVSLTLPLLCHYALFDGLPNIAMRYMRRIRYGMHTLLKSAIAVDALMRRHAAFATITLDAMLAARCFTPEPIIIARACHTIYAAALLATIIAAIALIFTLLIIRHIAAIMLFSPCVIRRCLSLLLRY